ncbi:hypothetical protein ALQ34_200047 [Pseudomonas syringae pv. maculicola]|nr:hypothetical protein ALQ34_200047 [Pseudomonas syringae pv. maculicola]
MEYQTIIATWATHFLLGRNQILDQFPRCVGEFVTLCHAGLQPIMAAILPQPTFRTKPRGTIDLGVVLGLVRYCRAAFFCWSARL